eukprot:gene6394-biopygen23872
MVESAAAISPDAPRARALAEEIQRRRAKSRVAASEEHMVTACVARHIRWRIHGKTKTLFRASPPEDKTRTGTYAILPAAKKKGLHRSKKRNDLGWFRKLPYRRRPGLIVGNSTACDQQQVILDNRNQNMYFFSDALLCSNQSSGTAPSTAPRCRTGPAPAPLLDAESVPVRTAALDQAVRDARGDGVRGPPTPSEALQMEVRRMAGVGGPDGGDRAVPLALSTQCVVVREDLNAPPAVESGPAQCTPGTAAGDASAAVLRGGVDTSFATGNDVRAIRLYRAATENWTSAERRAEAADAAAAAAARLKVLICRRLLGCRSRESSAATAHLTSDACRAALVRAAADAHGMADDAAVNEARAEAAGPRPRLITLRSGALPEDEYILGSDKRRWLALPASRRSLGVRSLHIRTTFPTPVCATPRFGPSPMTARSHGPSPRSNFDSKIEIKIAIEIDSASDLSTSGSWAKAHRGLSPPVYCGVYGVSKDCERRDQRI